MFHVFVPRVLWPEKPEISGVGGELNWLVWNQTGSHVSVGVPAEAYWVGGWPMVVLSCTYVGVLFAVCGRVSLFILTSRSWLLLPLLFLGMRLGTDFMADYFVMAYIGHMLYYIGYGVPIWLFFVAGRDASARQVKRRAATG